METVEMTKPIPSRRSRFRQYMAAFNPTASANDVLNDDLVFAGLHNSLYRNLAARAELELGSQQLVIGGIGSGKTTELLLAARFLEQDPTHIVVYFDLTSETDLTKLQAGAIIASFGMHLLQRVEPLLPRDPKPEQNDDDSHLTRSISKVKEFALGKVTRHWVQDDWYDDDDYDPSHYESGHYRTTTVPGKLVPTIPTLLNELEELYPALTEIMTLGTQMNLGEEYIVICDGLDRLQTPDLFWSVVHQDCRLFKKLKISLITTAPLQTLYTGANVADHFDRVHHLREVPPSGEGLQALSRVLVKRGAEILLNQEQIELLCFWSGGILRDLIVLCRDSAENAYLEGQSTITHDNISYAVEQLGNSYARGLGTKQRSILAHIRDEGIFDIKQPSNMELLATRRVIEYGLNDFRVNPALNFILDKAK